MNERVAIGSGRPAEALKWRNEVYEATSFNDLDNPSGQFETWDLKINDGLSKMISGELKREIELKECKHTKERQQPFGGRHICWLILKELARSYAEDDI